MNMHAGSTWNGPSQQDVATLESLRAFSRPPAPSRMSRESVDDDDDAPATMRSRLRHIGLTLGVALACISAVSITAVLVARRQAVSPPPVVAPQSVAVAPQATPERDIVAAKKRLAGALSKYDAVKSQGMIAVSEIVPATSAVGASPASPNEQATPSPDEIVRLRERATTLIRDGRIAGARALLERAARTNDPAATFALAETYDPKILADWKTIGLASDETRARNLYEKASAAGSLEAASRLEDMQR